MTIHRHPDTTARHALWLGGLVVVLAGLFGMHGLDSHGAAGMETVPLAVVTGASMDTVAADDRALAPVAHDPVSAIHRVGPVAKAMSVTTGHATMDMGMAAMCVAILAALVALLRLLRANQVRSVLWVLARPARAPAHPGRDRDPPSLTNLSIQRC